MTIILSTWIPRSYIHLREAFSKISLTNLDIKDIKFDENLTFVIKNIFQNVDINFILTPTGIYSLVVELPANKNTEDAIKKLKKILLDSLIKNWHTVTYKQIKNETIPLKFSALYFSVNKKLKLDNKLDKVFAEPYFSKNLSVYHIYQFAIVLMFVIDDYVLKMSEYYHKADKVVVSLKGEFELSELKRTVFEMDYIEKNTGEIMSRINDAKDCVEREVKVLKNIKFEDEIVKQLDLFSILKRVEVDLGYVDRLWQQMDIMLDNLDNASNARLSYQETVESRRVEWFLSVEAASVIATLLASVFISQFVGINAFYLGLIFLVVWMGIYFIMTKIRAK
ncbi:MAG: hypothetical protein ABIA91_02305 [Patescibacteria group bacterium]